MINFVVVDVVRTTHTRLAGARLMSIDDVRARSKPLVAMSADVAAEHLALKQFLHERLYKHYKVLRMTTMARRVISELFAAFLGDVNLMPPEHREAAFRAEQLGGEAGRARAVADYVAGMTDRFAIVEHARLFDPAERT
jgi:dGTPase